ncbi:hypothetical protein CSE899_10407 [Cronobacter sakazakii E899]|nr:hypothetical protein CSE899_10407 [Cronobacter sakazakii E899]
MKRVKQGLEMTIFGGKRRVAKDQYLLRHARF